MENWERNEYFTELIDCDYRKSRATYIHFLQILDLRSAPKARPQGPRLSVLDQGSR